MGKAQKKKAEKKEAPNRSIVDWLVKPSPQITNRASQRPTPRLPSSSRSSSSSLSVLSRTPSPLEATDARRSSTPEPSSAATPRSPSSHMLPNAFGTPEKPEPRQPVARDAEIKASDDEDSDEEFASLEALLQVKPRAAAPAVCPVLKDPCATPEAKRRRAEFFLSPLSVRPRSRHFNFNDLLEEARKDKATEARMQRYEEKERQRNAQNHEEMDGDALRDTLMDMAGDESDHDVDKVVRAVERTVVGSGRLGWHFFEEETGASKPAGAAFPAEAVSEICGPSMNNAAQLDMNVLNLSLTLSGKALPEELLLWLLDEICVEESDRRRAEYCERLSLSNDQDFASQITPSHLERLFKRLGATSDIHNLDSELATMECPTREYYRRDWRGLGSILEILCHMSLHLRPDSIEYCVSMLLRMAVDDEALRHPEISSAHRSLLTRLVSNYRRHRLSNWDDFCERMCKSIYTSFRYTPLRLRALGMLPSSSKAVHDLRRRMAAVFLFDDLSLARQRGDRTVTLEIMWKILQTSKFKARAVKDYTEFRAHLGLLDLALDLGNRPSTKERHREPSLTRRFNDMVDEIVHTLNKISSDIPDGGMKTIGPLEAKMEVDWIKERLKYNVRTRPPPKMTIFDHPNKPKLEPTVAEQKYMEKFLEDRPTIKKSEGSRSYLDDPFRSRPLKNKKKTKTQGGAHEAHGAHVVPAATVTVGL